MNFSRYGIDPDPKTVEVRMKALADEGLTPESFGVTDFQLRHHLDPSRSRELRELIKIDPIGRGRLAKFLPENHPVSGGNGQSGGRTATAAGNPGVNPNGHGNNPHPTIDLDQFDAAIERGRAGDGPKSNRRPSEVSIIFANKITPEPIEWLWVNSIAKRKLQLIAGAPGAGKSTIAFSLAATISSGGYWPDKTKASIGTVLIWSSEDFPGDTIVPRLMQMGADLNHIGFVRNTFTAPDRHRPFNPAVDMPALVEKVKQLGGVDLLILDPVVAAIPGSKDFHKNTEVRAGLQPVVDFAEAANCAVIGISHFTKGTSGKDPVERVTGSLAFGALPRIVWAVAENKSDEAASPRIFVRAKNNNGPSGGGFGFESCRPS